MYIYVNIYIYIYIYTYSLNVWSAYNVKTHL